MRTFWIFLQILIYSVTDLGIEAYYKTDIRLVARHYACDSRCLFNHLEISSKTIESFPKCEAVCGLLTFNSNTDLTEAQLKEAFKSMKTLKGGIKVEDSNLENLSFFGFEDGTEDFELDCRFFGLTIKNNSLLTDVQILTKFKFLRTKKRECPIRIEHNQQLSLFSANGSLCDSGHLTTVIDMRTLGNLKDCECPGNMITSETMSQFAECDVFFGGLEISGINENSKLPKITQIRGPLTIHNTDLKDLSFLENLDLHTFYEGTLALDIKDNIELTRLGFSLSTEYPIRKNPYIVANMENLHPDFCVTPLEMAFFLESHFKFKNIVGKFCERNDFCKFESMKTLGNGCTHILGDLIIESGDEVFVEKLKELTHLFGGIHIKNTKLENIEFLSKLKYIAYLESSLMIHVEGNKKMENFELPAIEHIIGKGQPYGIVEEKLMSSVLNWNSLPSGDGNFVDFNGCWGDRLHIIGPKYYEKCHHLDHGLIIKDANVSSDIYKLNIGWIVGEIEVTNTNLRNLSFFKLGDIGVKGGNLQRQFLIDIHHNSKMTRLGWTVDDGDLSVNVISKPLLINLEKNHPDFCLAVSEMRIFLDHGPKFRYLDARICDKDEPNSIEKTCRYKGMSPLQNYCDSLIGDVLIESGDENHAQKLRTVSVIFGSLTIRNTNLADLDFLVVRHVVNFNKNLATIRISNNTKLKKLSSEKSWTGFVQTGEIISSGPNTMIIDGVELFESTKQCMEFQVLSAANITYNGGNCHPQCTFSQPEISSKNIEFFPKCSVICGILIFNSNTDLSESQLKETFLNVTTLNGGIRIENSSFVNLSFFGPDLEVIADEFNIDCGYFGIHIKNNSNLTDVMKLSEWKFKNPDCPIRIENNQQLMLEAPYGSLCDFGYLSTVADIRTNGNLKDCESPEIISDGLKISNTTVLSEFTIITHIRGPIIVENTDLENLSLLENLESHKVREGTVALDVKNNLKMTRLGISLATSFLSPPTANFENLHPDFCVTIPEMTFFLQSQFKFKNFHGKFCVNQVLKNLCTFKSMKTLESECSRILGDLIIESGDEGYVGKLKSVTHLFGRVFIWNTTLKNSDFLSQLQYIAYLGSQPLIWVEGNKNMKKFSLPVLTHTITNRDAYGILWKNNKNLKLDVKKHFIRFYNETRCPGDKIFQLEMDFYKNCQTLENGLILTDTVTLPDFENVQVFKGQLEISNTNLENVSVLRSLREWQWDPNLNSGKISINIHNNPNMTRLGWGGLEKISSTGDFTINFEKNHRDFCLQIKEMETFIDNNAKFLNLEAKRCDFNPEEYFFLFCRFDSWETLHDSCVTLVGDVVIDYGDEKYITKLHTLGVIHGSLTIQNTNLTDINILQYLVNVINLSENPPIKISNNTNLRNINALHPEKIISRGVNTIVIDGDGIFNSTVDCIMFQEKIGTTVTYNEKSCLAISGGRGIGKQLWSLISIFVIFRILV